MSRNIYDALKYATSASTGSMKHAHALAFGLVKGLKEQHPDEYAAWQNNASATFCIDHGALRRYPVDEPICVHSHLDEARTCPACSELMLHIDRVAMLRRTKSSTLYEAMA
jgi:hypothetical protein